ncbi:hypothetical protein [Streptacidiphilus sp. EB103A]|uniref:hypothetical protein n=1 Tax=Streptacidiphilus sp. EB103A TaxID=3156275 RepID=UPI0035140C82
MKGRWELIEQSEVPKQRPGDGEDRLVLLFHDDATAVRGCAIVDGATDKSGRRYGDRAGGALAADRVADVLRELPSLTDPAAALKSVTTALAELRHEWEIPEDDLMAPSAVAATVDLPGGLIWRVGDIHVAIRRHDQWELHPAEKKIDAVVAAARAALLHCLLALGHSPELLAGTDPGRAMVMPILRDQNVLANSEGTPLGFGVLDGRRVPDRYLEVIILDEHVTEIVLASDGYLSPAPNLQAAEQELATSLADDPLRIGAHAATKAVTLGASSFDDRTYVRLGRRDPHSTEAEESGPDSRAHEPAHQAAHRGSHVDAARYISSGSVEPPAT